MRQDKVKDFTLTPSLIRRWELLGRLNDNDNNHDNNSIKEALEWITRGPKHRVWESAAGRIAILICEDISEYEKALADVGVSLLLVPIFGGPLHDADPFAFPRSAAAMYAKNPGACTIVANSWCTKGAAPPEASNVFAGFLTYANAEDPYAPDWEPLVCGRSDLGQCISPDHVHVGDLRLKK